MRLVPLVLVLPPLFTFLLTDPPTEQLASLVPAVGAFVAIAIWAALPPPGKLPRRALVATVLLTILAVVVVLIAPRSHWLVLFLFPVVTAGFLGSLRQSFVAIVVVSTVVAVAGWSVLGDPANRIERPLEFALIGLGALALGRLMMVNRQLEQARAEIARLAAADERLRISRDLHDLLGHGLSVISLKAQLAGRLLPVDPTRAAVEVADIEGVSRRALGDVRAAVGGYRRLRLDGELEGALIALEAAGVATDLDHQAGILPDIVDETFAWSVREGATNVVRHAHARKTVIKTRRDDGTAVLEIVNDDGRSTSAADGGSGGGTPAGSGLTGLAERAAAIGGRVEAGAQPDGGFRLAVIIPLATNPS